MFPLTLKSHCSPHNYNGFSPRPDFITYVPFIYCIFSIYYCSTNLLFPIIIVLIICSTSWFPTLFPFYIFNSLFHVPRTSVIKIRYCSPRVSTRLPATRRSCYTFQFACISVQGWCQRFIHWPLHCSPSPSRHGLQNCVRFVMSIMSLIPPPAFPSIMSHQV